MTAPWSGGAGSLWRQAARTALGERVEAIGHEAGKVGVSLAKGVVVLSLIGFSVITFAVLRQHGLKNDRVDQIVEPIIPPVTPMPVPRQANVPARSTNPTRAQRAGVIRPYPIRYDVLLTRSIFAAGGKAAMRSALPAGISSSADPSALLLMGISQEDAQFTAYVSDALGRSVMALHVGDSVIGGRVCQITLHDLAYQFGETVTRIEVGQGFAPSAEGPK